MLILVSALVGIVLLLPHEIEMLMTQSLWSVFLLPNIGFWQDAAYFDYTLFRPLLNLWSLGVELQFYLLFPLLLFVERHSYRLLLLIVGLSFLAYGVFSSIDPRNAFFLLPGRIWEFMAGFYACKYALGKFQRNRNVGSLCLLGLFIGILALPLINFDNNFVLSCIVVLLSCQMIRHGFTTGSDNNPISQSLLLLGKYSYSIYLVHFPVIVFMNYVPFEGTNLATDSLLNLAIIVLVIGMLSVLLHHAVESRTRKSLTPRSLFAISLGFCGVIAGLSVTAPALNRLSHSVEEISISNALLDRDMSRCERSQGTSALLSLSCSVNGTGVDINRRFLLHGDSHADGIKLPLAEALQARGHDLRITGSYAAVNSVNDSNIVITEAVQQDIDVIVLHSLPQADNGAALEDFLVAARQLGIHVAFIGPVPSYNYEVPKKLAVDLGLGMSRSPLGVELQSYLERNKFLFNVLEELASTYDNFTWYRSSDYLCDEYCYIGSEEWIPYYFDSNHLTLTGARLLTPVFESISLL